MHKIPRRTQSDDDVGEVHIESRIKAEAGRFEAMFHVITQASYLLAVNTMLLQWRSKCALSANQQLCSEKCKS